MRRHALNRITHRPERPQRSRIDTERHLLAAAQPAADVCPVIDRARSQRLGTARGKGAPDCPLYRPAALGRSARPFAQIRMVCPFHWRCGERAAWHVVPWEARVSPASGARAGRPPFAWRGLPPWLPKGRLPPRPKYVVVEACNPPTPTRGNIEVIDSGLDVRRDVVPIKLRIFIDDVRRRLVAELPVQTNLFKFVVKRIGFSQIVRIAKLTDEICGAQQ